jgi:energy-coupling factor transporter ATP-binding protein EcfA2
MESIIRKGIWFYGLSGSGKTHASNMLNGLVERPFLIDGDMVRTLISTDLGYSMHDRQKQINRMFGMAVLCLRNGCFPIISSVTMSEEILNKCIADSIEVVEIIRPKDQLFANREIYTSGTNVVGVDLIQHDFQTTKIYNNGTEQFNYEVLKFAQQS